MSSEDIRKQLPVDSDRFDRIDHDFKILMDEMVHNCTNNFLLKIIPILIYFSQALDTNVIKATNKDDLCDRLEELQQQLVLCEKALAEYLETKRLFFPRFYFVSSADLLDILSIGNQPKLVMKHLTKLFDSIAKLELEKNENNEISALGMYAKDGEYVPFDTSTDSAMTCVGPVEIWLNKVQLNMRASLRSYMGNAVVTYEEKPRDSWLFEYVA